MDIDREEEIFTSSIPDFENYLVTTEGKIINLNTGRELSMTSNQNGDFMVGLHKGGTQHTRSVKMLVAHAFVNGESPWFNTPILLNGDKSDLRAENITWRPRWFAWKYTRQFVEPQDWYFSFPVREINARDEYANVLHASVANGILCVDVVMSIHNETFVWPTGQKFEYI